MPKGSRRSCARAGRAVHVKSFEAHRARALLAARLQLIETTTRLSNHIRGVLKTFGLLPGTVRGLRFDARVELLLEGRAELALIVTPLLVAWRQLREQIAVFDKSILALVRASSVWALAIARKCGSGKARVALARKLSVILHAVWRSGEPFRAASTQAAA